MRTVYKYIIKITDEQVISLPLVQLLHVGLDPSGFPCVWAEVETEMPSSDVTIFVVGTGHPVPDGAWHVGSFVQGGFVWHIYA